jgi:hypothetical protein
VGCNEVLNERLSFLCLTSTVQCSTVLQKDHTLWQTPAYAKEAIHHQFYNKEEVKKDVNEWLWLQEPNFCHNRIFHLMPKQDKCIHVLRDCSWNQINELHLML